MTPHTLSEREAEVLTMIVKDGLTSKAVARRLGIETRTVNSHVEAICRKFGVDSRIKAALLWQQALIANDSLVRRLQFATHGKAAA